MVNSLCRDEVSASLSRCGLLDSDGERLVNDELQSRVKSRDTSSSFSSWTIKDQGGFIGGIQTDLGVLTLLAAIGRVSAPKMIHPDHLIGLNKCFFGVAPAD